MDAFYGKSMLRRQESVGSEKRGGPACSSMIGVLLCDRVVGIASCSQCISTYYLLLQLCVPFNISIYMFGDIEPEPSAVLSVLFYTHPKASDTPKSIQFRRQDKPTGCRCMNIPVWKERTVIPDLYKSTSIKCW